MTETLEGGERCWRVRTRSRVLLAAAMGSVFTAFLVSAIVAGPTVADLALLGVLAVCFVATYWIGADRPRVVLTASRVVVINPFRTFRRELADVVHVSGGWSGLWIHTRDEPPVAAWAVQKATISTWLGRSTRADEVADEISTAAAALAPSAGDSAFDVQPPPG